MVGSFLSDLASILFHLLDPDAQHVKVAAEAESKLYIFARDDLLGQSLQAVFQLKPELTVARDSSFFDSSLELIKNVVSELLDLLFSAVDPKNFQICDSFRLVLVNLNAAGRL